MLQRISFKEESICIRVPALVRTSSSITARGPWWDSRSLGNAPEIGPACETGTVAGLLFLLAHPDDETFIAGGTIAKYAAAGVEIGVVCATRGERGKTGDICSRDDLARVREAEVRDAAQILGIRHLEILSYEDQMLASAPPDEIRRAMVAALRRQRPQIAVTFDPNGMNLHPDHIAISRFASDAVAAAADPRWCPETGEPHTVERILWCGPGRVFDLGAMENIAGRAGMDFLIDISPYRDKKNAALRAHRTQYPGLKKLFGDDTTTALEAFRVAWGPRPHIMPAADLFTDMLDVEKEP
jgi:LmbE family N-acetylglucosaminyl deacetylase